MLPPLRRKLRSLLADLVRIYNSRPDRRTPLIRLVTMSALRFAHSGNVRRWVVMGILTSASLADIRSRGSVKDSDVLKLRQALHEAATITLEDADMLVRLHQSCAVKDSAWAEFFIEAIVECIVHQTRPEGYMVLEKARWLIGRLGQDGRLRSRIDFEVILSVLEAARWSPPSLAAFALDQVRRAVETGTGPLRGSGGSEPGAILPEDVTAVRRILLAFGGEAGFGVTRVEAEALLAIDAAINPELSTPAWTDLLVRAVGSGILAGLGRVAPRRSEALSDATGAVGLQAICDLNGHGRTHASAARWGAGEGSAIGGRRLPDGSGTIWATCRPQSAEERAMARLERQRLAIVTGEPIEEADAEWLTTRLSTGARPRVGANELAVLAYVQRQTNGLPSPLGELVARALRAA